MGDGASADEELTDRGTDAETTGEADDATGEDVADARTDQRARLVRIANVVGILLLVAIVVPFVLFAVPQLIGAEASYVVTSGSMDPALSPYDVTFVDAVSPSAVEGGDVINFQRGRDSRTTTHRVVEVVERDGATAFRTKGDNNPGVDQGVVTPEEFRGRVMTVGGAPLAIPQMGRVITFANSQTGFALLFVIPLTLLVVNEVWSVVSSVRTGGDPSISTDGGSESDDDGDASGGDPADADDDASVALSPNELRLAVLVLAGFVAYGGWTTYANPIPLNVGVTGSAVVAFALVSGIYLLGRGSDDDAPEEEPDERAGGDADGLVIHADALEEPDGDGEPNYVDSFSLMIDLAETSDGRLCRDPEDGTLHIAAGGSTYVYDPDRETTPPDIPDGGEVDVEPVETPASWGPPPASAGDDGPTDAAVDATPEGDDD